MGKVFHLKGLNGLRAIAAFGVVVAHINVNLVGFNLPASFWFTQFSGYGVSMFFSLSGFLITNLFLLEKEKYKDIDVRQFYIRRVLRIWPLYYLYLLLSVIILYIYQKEALPGSLIFYILLLANIPAVTANYLPIQYQYWSLAVEEQFYLVWPWIVKKVPNLLKWLVIFVLSMIALKSGLWVFYKMTGNGVPMRIVHYSRFHCMAIGAIGAILNFNKNNKFIKFSYSLPAQIISWAVIIVAVFNKFYISFAVNDELFSVVTVLLIVNVSGNVKNRVNLDNKLMNYFGKISYGLYVYHPAIIFLTVKLLGQMIKSLGAYYRYPVIYGIIILGTILIAHVSYVFFEKRFLSLKGKFSRILSSDNGSISITG